MVLEDGVGRLALDERPVARLDPVELIEGDVLGRAGHAHRAGCAGEDHLPRRRGVHDVVAERLELPCDHARRVGAHLGDLAEQERRRQRDAEATRFVAVGVGPRRRRSSGPRRLRVVEPDEHVEDAGGVAHRSAEDAVDAGCVVGASALGSEPDEAAGRLHPDEAAERGGDAHRTGAVGAVRDRAERRRGGGRGTTARSARRALGVPRVAADAVELRRRHRRAELRHVRLAQHREARGPQPLDERVVVRGDVVGEHLARVRGREALGVDDVLE